MRDSRRWYGDHRINCSYVATALSYKKNPSEDPWGGGITNKCRVAVAEGKGTVLDRAQTYSSCAGDIHCRSWPYPPGPPDAHWRWWGLLLRSTPHDGRAGWSYVSTALSPGWSRTGTPVQPHGGAQHVVDRGQRARAGRCLRQLITAEFHKKLILRLHGHADPFPRPTL
jgi:hypothetical protein